MADDEPKKPEPEKPAEPVPINKQIAQRNNDKKQRFSLDPSEKLKYERKK